MSHKTKEDLFFKECKRCGIWKFSTDFGKSSRNKDGHIGVCKQCKAIDTKKHREENKEKEQARSKKYREENKEKEQARHKKYNSNPYNKIKRQEYYKKYSETNKENIKQRKQKYYNNNKDSISEKHKKYREENKEKESLRHSYYHENNKEKINKRISAWQKNNREKCNNKQKKYRQTDNGKLKSYLNCMKRRARKLKNGVFNVTEKYIIKEQNRLFCPYCGDRLIEGYKHLDHIIPISRGGQHREGNLTMCCSKCNLKKSSKLIIEFKNAE